MQLPEQLGEIDHIFCDKTGTLTQNDLDVKALCVAPAITCFGETRAALNVNIAEAELDSRQIRSLYQCFCLCNEMRVATNPTNGLSTYDGASSEEMLLLQMA